MKKYKSEWVELSTKERDTLENALSILKKIDNLLQRKDLDGIFMQDNEQKLINDLSRYSYSLCEYIRTDN